MVPAGISYACAKELKDKHGLFTCTFAEITNAMNMESDSIRYGNRIKVIIYPESGEIQMIFLLF